MNRRRRYIIDKKFQFRTALSVLSVTTLLSLIILLILIFTAVYNNNRISNIIKSEDQIFQALTTISIADKKEVSVDKKIDSMSNDHIYNFYMSAKIIRYNIFILLGVLAIIIIQGIILFVLLIKKTHRIAGPVYLMSNYLKEIMQGKIPVTRPLRKKDELVDFYNLFTQYISQLKQNKK
jgi:hypothetical protein